ncbi:DUF2502 domain-containing protein [Rouxiella badensis]|nr:DUF2502 domain-containing protein [Rouxiella badensis]
MMKKLPVVKIALGALLFGLLPATMPAHADGISINVPGLSISIGQRDNRGYYWDGYDWRSPYWWQHRNEYYGHRNDRGYYWDGARWRDGGWWNQHGRGHGGPDLVLNSTAVLTTVAAVQITAMTAAVAATTVVAITAMVVITAAASLVLLWAAQAATTINLPEQGALKSAPFFIRSFWLKMLLFTQRLNLINALIIL